MKTIFFRILSLVFLYTFSSCKKDTQISQSATLPEVIKHISISSKGYLIFPKADDIIEFGKKLYSPDRESLISTLQEKGFKKRITNSSEYGRDENSIYNLIFNEDGILQISGIIMKITDNDKFLFTLKEQYADQETFTKLMNEVYDALKMNKINVDRDMAEQFDLIDFTTENPYGQFESIFNGTERRPMFGSSVSNYCVTDPAFYNGVGGCTACTNCFSQTTIYIFWIGFSGEPVFQSQSCVSVPTCK